MVERPHTVTLDGSLAPRRQVVDHDEENVDHVVVGLGQKAIGEAGEGGQPALGRPLAEALGLGRGRVGGKGTHPPGRQPIQSEATGAGDALDLAEPIERSDQTVDRGGAGRTSQSLQQRQSRLGLDVEEAFEAYPVRIVHLGTDDAPAPSCGAVAHLGDETGERGDAGQQDLVLDEPRR